jgi:hypothetical protein
MRNDRIGKALDAGRRWAEKQLEDGIEITPSSTLEAAQQQFEHVGSRELFWRAALDTALLKGGVNDDTNRPQDVR